MYTAWNFLYNEPNESESANYTERAVSNYVNMNTVNYIGSDKLIVLWSLLVASTMLMMYVAAIYR